MTRLTSSDLELLRGENYAWYVTLRPDGSPHASITWVDATDTHVLINTAEGRLKDRNVQRDPRVTVGVQRHDDAYVWISIDGEVEERVTGDEGLAHIDALSRRYDGKPWTPTEGQVRAIHRIRPIRIVRY
ncbi:MAG TPA: TIGR03618 family F420-dependent PPOX class oxidoreductase [Actinomycetota bacterium]|nr:TIGR03618 family F420-dependent PPOX class oxidoreductase [Actinomycetota bacterium]